MPSHTPTSLQMEDFLVVELLQLPKPARQALTMFYLDGATDAEIVVTGVTATELRALRKALRAAVCPRM